MIKHGISLDHKVKKTVEFVTMICLCQIMLYYYAVIINSLIEKNRLHELAEIMINPPVMVQNSDRILWL